MRTNAVLGARARMAGEHPQRFRVAAVDREGRGRAMHRSINLRSEGVRRWSISILALALLSICGLAQANVGRTAGTFHVVQDGAATYTIPIFAPRGPNDLEPHIALTYDSQDGPTYVGVGWSVSGLSEIYRCNKTVAQDGAAAGVALVSGDGYCLDSERLRLTTGTYGAAGSVYQTEIANFSQATAEQTQGNGPAYWTVQGKDGLTYEYGHSGASQVTPAGLTTPYQWWLDKVTDRAGNTMTITYSTANASGEVVPETIA